VIPLLPDLPHLVVFLAATLALNLTPGPDMLYIMARGVEQGRAAAVASVAGIALGILIHTLVAAFGLASVLASSRTAYEGIRYAGATYLCYLGVRVLLAGGGQAIVGPLRGKGLPTIFRQGVVTNVLNSKVGLFLERGRGRRVRDARVGRVV
jgi:threonine/homoserine/homoserine lactone efflux protein